MNPINPAYIDIELTDPRHRQIIRAALKSKDTEALTDLKGNTHKPIRFVMQWFLYALMHHEHDQSDYVVIYSLDSRKTIAKVASLGQQEGSPEVDSDGQPIPLDTYDFLP